MKLSILIPTVPSRFNFYLPRILNQLLVQINNNPDIELLVLFDNKRRTTGDKRSALLSISNGEYLTFIDDDDTIADTYVEDIMDSLKKNPDIDCVVFDCICTLVQLGGLQTYCKYGIEYDYWESSDRKNWTGKPAHTMVWKSSIAKSHVFDSINNGEDTSWVKRACLDIKTQARIDKVLYFYEADRRRSEW